MALSEIYEDFAGYKLSADVQKAHDEELAEDVRLKAFENGYSAGWDDALKAKAQNEAQLNAAVQSALQNIALSRDDILDAYAKSLEPLVHALVEQMLPNVLTDTLGLKIEELIRAKLELSTEKGLVVEVSERDFDAVAAQLTDATKEIARIQSSHALQSGQVSISLDGSAVFFDPLALVEEIRTLVQAHYHSFYEGK